MKKTIFISVVFILCLNYSTFSQPEPTFEIIKEKLIDRGSATIRTDVDVIVPIHGVTHDDYFYPWEINVCYNDPGPINSVTPNVYAGVTGFFGYLDVNKLREIPYTDDDASRNPDLIHHTFWFMFGCCGEVFCADDFNSNNVFNFPDQIGSLKLGDVDVNWNTTVWIDFMTQCENCTTQYIGSGGEGSWYKWEKEYLAGELMGITDPTMFPDRLNTDVTFVTLAPCQSNASYGCQNGELTD